MTSVLSVISVAASTLVGSVFLLTGTLKVFAPSSTVAYFKRLDLLPWSALRILLWIAAVFESAIGVGLVVRAFPSWLFPAAILILLAFAVFTAWSAISRKVEDCGCYGKLLKLSPAKSVALDALYVSLAAAAWVLPARFALTSLAQAAVPGAAALLFGAAATYSHSYYIRSRRDLWDLNPLKVNRAWKPEWLAGYAEAATGATQMVVLMSPSCPACKEWVKPLNKIASRVDMPQVIAGMAAAAEEIDRTVRQNGIEFTVLPVRSHLMARMADGFPVIVVVEGGLVRSKDKARLPQPLVDRLKGTPSAIAYRTIEPGAAMLRPMPGRA